MKKISNDELGRVSADEFKTMKRTPIILIADNLRSLNNIGSLFRSADAFAIEKIYLCGITATPPNRDIHKTALGAELTIDWEYKKTTMEAVAAVKDDNYTVIAIEQVEKAVMLNDFMVEDGKKYAIILGNEVKGVDQEVVDNCDLSIEIPQSGTKHSLNVSVAAGVVLWHLYQQLL